MVIKKMMLILMILFLLKGTKTFVSAVALLVEDNKKQSKLLSNRIKRPVYLKRY